MTHAQLIESISHTELLEWNVFHNADKWREKINETDEGRSQRILQLITTGK